MSMETLSSGTGESCFTDPDGIRASVRDHERWARADRISAENCAVARLLVSSDFPSFALKPLHLIRGITRRGRRNLWHSAEFTSMGSTLPAARLDVSLTDVGSLGRAEG